jgi:HK97 family phage portal protein
MRLFGFEITRQKRLPPQSTVNSWMNLIREGATGDWQRNVETVSPTSASLYFAVFACTTLIASDISKLEVFLQSQEASGVWSNTRNPAYSPLLRKPNPWQTRAQFFESWVLSKLQTGNAYILKSRDRRGVVNALYVLDPTMVKVLVSEGGDIFYDIKRDSLSGMNSDLIVPAREIIHDRFNCLYHPLVGISPIRANLITVTQGLNIQKNSSSFFGNNSMPGGILIAPGAIKQETAQQIKEAWDTKFRGKGFGSVAVLGDGLKYEQFQMNSADAQMLESLKWTADVVCSTFHVPPYKIGIGPTPSYNNIQALNVEYYSQCLQVLIEAIETSLEEGIELPADKRIEFDRYGLLKMDSQSQITVLKESVGSGLISPNEGRKKLDLSPVEGGDTPYLQQQNFSLAALARRDAEGQDVDDEPPDPAVMEMQEQLRAAREQIAQKDLENFWTKAGLGFTEEATS